MKIGIVCFPTFGGSGVIATELGLFMAKQGHEVHFIAYQKPARLADLSPKNIYYHHVEVLDYPLFKYQPYEYSVAEKIIEITKEYQLDLVHTHYAIPHTSATYMAKQALHSMGINIKTVTTLHGTEISQFGHAPNNKLLTFNLDHSDAITAVSHSLKQDTLKALDISKPIEVIYNFIDLTTYKPATDKSYLTDLGLNIGNEQLIGHVSNFRDVKRPLDVIKVFYEVQKEQNAKLMMIGGGPLLDCCRLTTKKLGLTDKVLFVGAIPDIYNVMPCLDLLMVPSENESFGLSALEAMACGVPVISTNVGGLPELNKHNESGFLTDVGDIPQMVTYATQLLKDVRLHASFKKRALEIARQFCINGIAVQYETIYESCLT